MYHFKTMYFVKIHLFDLESKLKETVTMFDSLITKMFKMSMIELTNIQDHVNLLILFSLF